ncbi:MAG: pseudouridine synthase [Burkholderiales bacterium]|jgi:23S rRNA pseudouridine955/2504/2580 synthase|nr:pseudouridine synthase [Burkholderiales bacterium]
MKIFSKNQVNFYTVTEKDEYQRLDNLLAKLLKGVPKSYIYRIIRNKEVKVNNKKSDAHQKVTLGDIVRIPPVKVAEINAPIIPEGNFPVLYEDDYFLIIDKPSGVACHGGSGVSFGVIEQLRQNYPQAKFLELAHRLDRDTSGVLILAKKRQALVQIQEIIRNSKIKKYYLALTLGRWRDQIRNVKAPLFKYLTADGERRVRIDQVNGKFAHTIFSVVKSWEEYTLVKADIKTGRTHQIRVHLQHLGYPIAGDDKYGEFDKNKVLAKEGLRRMFLHACQIEFTHPVINEKLVIKSKLPAELEYFCKHIEQVNKFKY